MAPAHPHLAPQQSKEILGLDQGTGRWGVGPSGSASAAGAHEGGAFGGGPRGRLEGLAPSPPEPPRPPAPLPQTSREGPGGGGGIGWMSGDEGGWEDGDGSWPPLPTTGWRSSSGFRFYFKLQELYSCLFKAFGIVLRTFAEGVMEVI